MQNKRGISQVFSSLSTQSQRPSSEELALRPATVFDVFEASEVLLASITQLCQLDHRDDSHLLAQWCANKTPEDIRGWILAGEGPTLAVSQGKVLGVGLATAQAKISLLYAAPWGQGCGVGRALLQHLEAGLVTQGHTEAHLTATQSGLDFYLSQGWQRSGAATNCFGLPGQPMRKRLQVPL